MEIRIKYFGALHLWFYFSNTFLQRFRSPAALYQDQMMQAPNLLQINSCVLQMLHNTELIADKFLLSVEGAEHRTICSSS